MRNNSSPPLAAAAFAMTLSVSVAAEPTKQVNNAELVERIQQLEMQMQALKAQLKTAESQSEQQLPTVSTSQKKNENSLKWKGAPEVKNTSGWSIKPRGRILYDFANLSSVPANMSIPGEGFTNEARRIRIGIQGSMPGGFGYKLETDIIDGTTLTDAFFDFKTDSFKVIVGQHNNFQGLEELTSSNDISFMERAAFTDAFGFQRKLGISLTSKLANVNLQAGIFTDSVEELDDQNNTVSVDMRAFSSPKIDDMQLHIGGSLHHRDLGDSFDSVRYRARPLVHTVDTRFVNTGSIAGAEKENSVGLEFGLIAQRFHAMAEMHKMTVVRNEFDDADFFGGAVELGYFLTNDSREYKGGVFKGVKVNEPVSSGGWGAWQVNFKYDRLDLVDADIFGGKQDAYMASLIWTPINNLRILLNYGHISYSEAMDIVDGAPDEYSVNVFGARTQISF